MAKVQAQDNWVVSQSVDQVSQKVSNFLRNSGMKIESQRNPGLEWVLSQGSEVKTRLLGGWSVQTEDLPKQALVRLTSLGYETQVEVIIEECLGFGYFDPKLKQKYNNFFEQWIDSLRTVSGKEPKHKKVMVSPRTEPEIKEQLATPTFIETSPPEKDVASASFVPSMKNDSTTAIINSSPSYEPIQPQKVIPKSVSFESGMGKRIWYYFLVNACIMGTLVFISPYVALAAPIYGFFAAFFWLVISKWLLKSIHRVQVIKPGAYHNSSEESLYRISLTYLVGQDYLKHLRLEFTLAEI